MLHDQIISTTTASTLMPAVRLEASPSKAADNWSTAAPSFQPFSLDVALKVLFQAIQLVGSVEENGVSLFFGAGWATGMASSSC